MPVRGGSRGQKKPSIRDLSREMPTSEDLRIFLDGAESENARSVALVLASFVESLLENAVNFSFVSTGARGTGLHGAIFREASAPLSSFSAKILIGLALGVYDKNFRKQLDRFRIIRNVFAHSMKRIDFDEPSIKDECLKLDPRLMTTVPLEMGDTGAKERFVGVGIMAANHLMDYGELRLSQMMTEAVLTPFRGKPG